MFGSVGSWEILIAVIVIVVVFGSSKLPGAARSIGRSLRIFKSEVKEMQKDGDKSESAAATENSQSTDSVSPQKTIEAPNPGGKSPIVDATVVDEDGHKNIK